MADKTELKETETVETTAVSPGTAEKDTKKKKKGRKRKIIRRLIWTLVILLVVGVALWSVYSKLMAEYKITYDPYVATTGSISNSLSFTGSMQLTEKTGDLAALMFVPEDEDILLITDDGTIIRARAADVRLCGRATQGVRVMRLAEGSTVVGVCRAEKEEEETPEEAEGLTGEDTATISDNEEGKQ